MMKKEKFKCPYCGRKIGYGIRLTENKKGEHTCNHCNKISNIKQDTYIWILLILCSVLSILILIFYISSANSIQNIYDDTGKMKFLVSLFFGKLMIFKWIIWELIPFIAFYFFSPALSSEKIYGTDSDKNRFICSYYENSVKGKNRVQNTKNC